MESCSPCPGIPVHVPVETPFTIAWNTHTDLRDNIATLVHQHRDDFAPDPWAHHIRDSRSFSDVLSTSDSAGSFVSVAFSASRFFNLMASETVTPPNFEYQL